MKINKTGVIELAHGSGGRATASLINDIFYAHFGNAFLDQQADQATLPPLAGRPVFTTDSHVVSPLVFPGGDIGRLAVYGTVNDIAVCGATPQYLSAGFIIEEGFSIQTLDQIVSSMAAAAKECNVSVVTGDTKVVGRGQADGLYINTSAIGDLPTHLSLGPNHIKPGQKIIINGSLGDHAVAILSERESIDLNGGFQSDAAPLVDLIQMMLNAAPGISAMRDLTRGGLSACLNELAQSAGCGFKIKEQAIPINANVKAVCELLGLEALALANEGKLVAFCPPEQAEALVSKMRSHPLGTNAAVIGEVVNDPHHFVSMETLYGGARRIAWQWSDPLPRIC